MRRVRTERGAVLLELALTVSLLASLVIGTVELGLAWSASTTVSGALATGARVGATMSADPAADHEILAALGTGLGGVGLARTELVVVYRAASSGAEVPPGCLTAGAIDAGGSGTDQCNVYSGDTLRAVAADPEGTAAWFQAPGCAGQRDMYWCPSSRSDSMSAPGGPDLVGVFVRVKHQTVTGFLGTSLTIEDRAVMALEPDFG